MKKHLAPFLGEGRFDPWSGMCWRKLLTIEKREISPVCAIGNGARASPRRSDDPPHGKDAALPSREAPAGPCRSCCRSRCGSGPNEWNGCRSCRSRVRRGCCPDLRTRCRCSRPGNGYGNNRGVGRCVRQRTRRKRNSVFQSGEARGGLLLGSFRCQRCRSGQTPVVGTDLRHAVLQMVHAVSK